MYSQSGSHSFSYKIDHWNVCGGKFPRAEIFFFAQLLICITLNIASILMLGLHDENRDLWMVTLSSLVGNIMPTPNYPKVIKNKGAG